jgi:hypothetical protein
VSDAPEASDEGVDEPLEAHVQRVRLGHGANCSSVGSVVDTLFATAVVGAAVFAAVVAALEREDVRVVGRKASSPNEPAKGPTTDATASRPKGEP